LEDVGEVARAATKEKQKVTKKVVDISPDLWYYNTRKKKERK
jgi:hypothetical protein